MVTPVVAGEFLEYLRQSRLLTAEQFDEVVDRYQLAGMDSSMDMAKKLVLAGVLTRFQAEHLLEGRSRGFFLDDYKILRVLAIGGMGRLFLAEDTRTGRQVALKKLAKRHENDPGMIARFQLEARAGLTLKHPNIVRTRRLARAEGLYGDINYFIMDFIEGINLEELVQLHGPLDPPQACDMMSQAAAALHFAHKRGMIHRDVKPANFLINHDGQVRILDFGLSLVRKGEEEDEFSLAMIFGQDCLGTADYIAPEQSLDSYGVDARADIYSLGGTFYYALTGQVPFPMKRIADKVAAHRTKTARPIKELAPHVSDDVAAIVTKMMARQPDDRFQTVRELYDVLRPLSQRRRIEFDFEEMLLKRETEAKQRAAAIRQAVQKTATPAAAETPRPNGTDAPSDRPGSSVDTMIRKDSRAPEP